jgi:Glycosyl hydrolases family 15
VLGRARPGDRLGSAARLTDQRGLVYRYLAHDGLAGEEGTFLLCTFWLAQAQALAGELDQATATFERAVAAINDVGLLAEEVDPGSGEMIGNFPQAFSHIGLINAAWAIAQAQESAAGGGPGTPARNPGRPFRAPPAGNRAAASVHTNPAGHDRAHRVGGPLTGQETPRSHRSGPTPADQDRFP